MLFSIYEIEKSDKFKGGEPSKEEMDIILKYIGRHQKPKFPIKDKELSQGIDVEKEHSDSKEIATNIARDHLAEMPDYYKRLSKLEKDGESNVKRLGLDNIYKEG